ncbi:MAG: hypothetical protein ABFR53_08895, partial [Actinomycetota bacterium]
HLGSLITGSWLGTVSSLPWASAAPGSDVTRHPVEIYAAALFLAAAIGIALWKQKGRPPLGAPAGLSLAAAGAARLVTEPMRVSLTGGPVWLYAAAVVGGLGLAAWAVMTKTNARRTTHDA